MLFKKFEKVKENQVTASKKHRKIGKIFYSLAVTKRLKLNKKK